MSSFSWQTLVMKELKSRVEELQMENMYQLRLKDMSYNEKIKELTEKFIEEMESLKIKNQVWCMLSQQISRSLSPSH